MRFLFGASLLLAFGSAANAHNSWLEPKTFQAPAGSSIPVTFFVGHHGDQRSAALAPRPTWLQSMRAVGSAGSVDLMGVPGFNPAKGVPLRAAGTYVLSLETGDFISEMAPDEFEVYLEQEGLAAAQIAWQRRPVTGRKVRESYRRHAKTFVSIGRDGAALEGAVTTRLGQRLEIVPAVNPYRLRGGDSLSSTVWFEGRPLGDAQVTLSNLDRPEDEPMIARSDRAGKLSYRLAGGGRWMMNVVWSVPSTTAGTDYQTSFASLTFAVPDSR